MNPRHRHASRVRRWGAVAGATVLLAGGAVALAPAGPAAAVLPGQTHRVSVSSTGQAGDVSSNGGDISDDGRYVAFASSASNLVPGDTNGVADVFVRDRLLGETTRVSVSSAGAEGAWAGWTLTFSGPGLTLGNGWGAVWSQTGDVFAAGNETWNVTVPPGGSVNLGLQGGRGAGAFPTITDYAIDGMACMVMA